MADITPPTEGAVKKLNTKQRNRILDISYACHAAHYKPKLDQYDFVILSQVLHYMNLEMATRTLEMVSKVTMSNTKIYLSFKDGFNTPEVIKAYRKTFPPMPEPMTKEEILKLCDSFANKHNLYKRKYDLPCEQGDIYVYHNLDGLK